MGQIKTSALISDITGKVGGNVFARNRYGLSVRSFTAPVNVNSTLQQAARSAMASLVERWSSTLTSSQREAWTLYADSVAMQNKLGETMYLTGQNHFVRANAVLVQNGLTPVDDGPTTFELPEQDPSLAVAISEAAQELSITFDDTRSWCNEDGAYMFVYMGSPQNPQRNFFGGPYKYAGKIEGDSASAPTSPETVPVPFVATEGQRVWISCRICRADGRISERFRASGFCGS
jgi:hypothetical protein